jgi:hypothetical protein
MAGRVILETELPPVFGKESDDVFICGTAAIKEVRL